MTILNEIVDTGRITRGYLGVELANTPPPGAGVGLQITRVEPDGPAHHAGVRIGDFILAIDEQPAVNSTAVSRQIAHTPPGSKLNLDVLRGSEQLSFSARAGQRPIIDR